MNSRVNLQFGITAMKKRVYITMSHHHVIKEWFRYQQTGVHLLSFDYHTDFHEAFIRQNWNPLTHSCENNRTQYLTKHIPCQDVNAAIKDLKNDEHIDFAIRSGMIEKAFVFSHDSNPGARVLSVPNREKLDVQAQIVSYCEVWHPLATPLPYDDSTEANMSKIVTTDAVLNEVVKTFCQYGFNQANYILDFDCDFIRDKDAMTHGNLQTLKNLIDGAKAITIAREPSCVDECSKHTLSYGEVEDWLVALIKESCGGDVEFDGEEMNA